MKLEPIVKVIAQAIFEKKGKDVKALNLINITTVTDYFIICTAESDTQAKAIADHIEHTLIEHGVKVWHKEGYQGLTWVLLDYVDVVIHIFRNEYREFYNLEKLWGDAPVIELKDEPEVKKPVRKRKVATAKE